MLERIFNVLDGMSVLLDIIAEFIVNTVLVLLVVLVLGILTFIGFQYSVPVGVIVLIVSLSFLKVMM